MRHEGSVRTLKRAHRFANAQKFANVVSSTSPRNLIGIARHKSVTVLMDKKHMLDDFGFWVYESADLHVLLAWVMALLVVTVILSVLHRRHMHSVSYILMTQNLFIVLSIIILWNVNDTSPQVRNPVPIAGCLGGFFGMFILPFVGVFTTGFLGYRRYQQAANAEIRRVFTMAIVSSCVAYMTFFASGIFVITHCIRYN